jgi:hypothetical protein
LIANAYDKLSTALNKLRFDDRIKIALSGDSLEAVAGKNLVAEVFVPATDPEGIQYGSVNGIAALYDAAGRLVAHETVIPDKGAATTYFTVSLPVPAGSAGFTYKFFLWDADTMVPLTEPTSLTN